MQGEVSTENNGGFKATSDWQIILIPFADLEAYKTSKNFHQSKLKRIGKAQIEWDSDGKSLAEPRFTP